MNKVLALAPGPSIGYVRLNRARYQSIWWIWIVHLRWCNYIEWVRKIQQTQYNPKQWQFLLFFISILLPITDSTVTVQILEDNCSFSVPSYSLFVCIYRNGPIIDLTFSFDISTLHYSKQLKLYIARRFFSSSRLKTECVN